MRWTRPLLRLIGYWLPPLLWMGLIFYLSSQTRLPVPQETLWRQLTQVGGHLAEFGGLFLLLNRSFATKMPGPQAYGWAFLAGLLYAVSDELHQSMIPGRHCTVLDVLTDALGMLLALALVAWRDWARPRWAGRRVRLRAR